MTFDELWGKHTPNSWARVPRGPASVAVGSFLFGSTGVLATTTIAGVSLATVGGFLVTTAVTSWALSALAPKPDVGSNRSSLGNVKEATGPFDIVYGQVRKGGVITFLETSDRQGYKLFKDDYLHMIVVLAGHEVEEIGDVYLNDEKVTIDADGMVREDRWDDGGNPMIRIKKYTGSSSQTADPDLVAETSVTSAFRGRGIAYLYIRMDWEKGVFSDGIPTFTAMVKGRKVWDPRTNETKWTDNAALCIRDYLARDFGLNSAQSPNSLSSTDWNIAADVCDTLITKKNGQKEKRYTLNGVLQTSNTPRTNIQNMLTSCGGTLFWGQGKWQFKVGYFPSGPYVEFGEDDLRSGINLATKNSRKENFNAVTGVFIDSAQDYTEVEYPRVSSSVFLARDNGQDNVLDMPLPYTTSASAAQRLAKMAMFRSREEIVISADFNLKAADVKVGDVVQFTFSRYGFNKKFFEVISWRPTVDNNELKINLTLKETSAAAYDWNAEENDILSNNTHLPDPTAGLVVSNLSVVNKNTLQSDGTLLGEVTLSWDAAESAFVDKYTVQWKKATDSAWSATETDETEIVIPSIKSGVSYNYRVRAVSSAGFVGAWEQISRTVSGKDTPPGLPTSVATKNGYRNVQISWNNPADLDLNHIEVYAATSNNSSAATLVGKSGGTKFIHDLEPAQTRWYFLKAVDNSNNKSGFTSGKQGTALFIENSDVDINVKEIMEDAGLAAVEVLDSLPTTGNFEGRTVYLTTDQKMYTYTGGSWKPLVDYSDIDLEINNFPSNLRPIEVVSSLPASGNFEGRMVYLTTDNKLYRHTGSPTNASGFTAAVPTSDLTGTISEQQLADFAVTSDKIKQDAITRDKILDGAISELKLVDGAVSDAKIAGMNASKIAGQITSVQIKDSAVGADKIASSAVSAIKLANNSVERNKIVDSAVNAGKLASQSVSTDKIVDSSISTVKLSDNAVTSSKIVSGAVSAVNLANNSVERNKIVDSAIDTSKITDGAITSGKITAGAITAGKIATGAVTAGTVAANSIGASEIAAGSIVASKLAITNTSNLILNSDLKDSDGWDLVGGVSVVPSIDNSVATGNFIFSPGETTDSRALWGEKDEKRVSVNPGEQYLVGGSFRPSGSSPRQFSVRIEVWFYDKTNTYISGSSRWAANTVLTGTSFVDVNGRISVPSGASYMRISFTRVGGADTSAMGHGYLENPYLRRMNEGEVIVDGAISTDKLAANAVTAGKIEANAITSDKIEANAITSDKIQTNAITSAKINAGAIVAGKLAVNAVEASNIATGAITADKVSANSIGADKIASNAITSSKIAVASIENLFSGFDKKETSPFLPLGWDGYWSTVSREGQGSIVLHYGQNRDQYQWYKDGVNPGDEYYISFYAARSDDFDGTTDSKMRFADGNNDIITGIYYNHEILPHFTQGWVKLERTIVIPDGVTSLTVQLWGDQTGGQVYLTNMVMRQRNGGELIVDGAITANKIFTNAVTAAKIDTDAVTALTIKAGAVEAGKLAVDAVLADNVKAGAIVAGKLSTNSVVAGNIVGRTITAGKIDGNTITANEIASGAIKTDELDSKAVTALKIDSGAITADKIDGGAVTAGKLDANSVNAGAIQAGAVTADKIQANSIVASKLVVSDFTNLVPDYNIEDLQAWTNQSNFNVSGSGPSFHGTNWVTQTINNNTGGSFISRSFPVIAGQDYFASIQARCNSGDNVDMWARVIIFDNSGNIIDTKSIKTGSITSSVTTYNTSFNVPYGGTKAQFLWSHGSGNGTAYVGTPTVRLKNNGELIVDGAIKADHLAVNSVSAGAIQAGAVKAGAIESGAVTAAKIDVNNLSAISANLGTITGGSLNINNNFIVNSNGQATIRSGTSGERLVINNNRIDVYDSSGKLRVRIGQL